MIKHHRMARLGTLGRHNFADADDPVLSVYHTADLQVDADERE
jgi:hypothetical protein